MTRPRSSACLVAILMAWGCLHLHAQEQAPSAPKQDPPPPSQEDILYEKYRYEKDGFVTIFYRVGHERGKILKALLEGKDLQIPGQPAPAVTTGGPRSRILSPDGYASETENLHLLIVCDKKDTIGFVERVLKSLDIPDPQIIIEARVVELRWDHDLQFGIEGDLASAATSWINNADSGAFLRDIRTRFNPTEVLTGGPFQGSVFRFNRTSSSQGTIGGIVQMFVDNGKAEILSNPRVVVESGDSATVSAGEKIPYFKAVLNPAGSTTTVDYIDTGVKMVVKPHIVGASNVQLELSVDVTAVLAFVTGPTVGGATASAPAFSTRRIETRVTVHDGDEVVMGGLTRKEKSRKRRGIPILSDIPIIGWLFGRYEEDDVTQEILFFIRPTIMQGARTLPAPLIDPDRKK